MVDAIWKINNSIKFWDKYYWSGYGENDKKAFCQDKWVEDICAG